MTIQEFELKIKAEIHPDLKIVQHPVNLDMAGVYFREAYLCGVPSQNIYEVKNPGYVNAVGSPHVSYPEVIGRIQMFLNEMKKDDELYSLMAKPADQL